MRTLSTESWSPPWFNTVGLALWFLAGAVVFLPFAHATSPLDALMLKVPGNQGNWWHALIGAPFFLAFLMIWLRARSLLSEQPSTRFGRSLIWLLVGLSICGTIAVQVPFLLHRAGTSELQRLSIIGSGFGILVASAVFLLRGRGYVPSHGALLIGLNAAYLANAALCLIVYADAGGSISSRLGWVVTAVIVWPMLAELLWYFVQISRRRNLTDRTGIEAHG